MKYFIQSCLVILFVFVACKDVKKEKNQTKKQEITYSSFGEKISEDNALTTKTMEAKYKDLQVGDTIDVKFASKINEVCSKKGCWMKLPIEDKETFVRFKDYGFFMPLDSQGREVIIEGKAFVKVTSVKELQHYAEDAGKSKEEIAKITQPKKEFAFLAHGVLMK